MTSDSLALGLALRLDASRLIVVKSCAVDASATLAQWAADGIVDRRFPTLAAGVSMRIEVVGPAQIDQIRAALLAEG